MPDSKVIADGLRIDKFLWHIRLSKSRSTAQALIGKGHVRINGARVERSSILVHIGDTITLPRGEAVLAIRVLTVPSRRGPALEAQACYEIM